MRMVSGTNGRRHHKCKSFEQKKKLSSKEQKSRGTGGGFGRKSCNECQ